MLRSEIHQVRARSRMLQAWATVGAALLVTTHDVAAQASPCALVTPAEVQTLIGKTPGAGDGNARSCRWGAVRDGNALVVLTYANLPPQAMDGIRRGMERDTDARMDEPTLGAGAASALTSFGVVVIAPKDGRLLQLQYHVGHKGVAADREKLRPVAKAVLARF